MPESKSGLFFIVGYGPDRGSASGLCLYLAAWETHPRHGNSRLREVGHLSADGLGKASAKALKAALNSLATKRPTLYRGDPAVTVHAEPCMIAEVRFEGWEDTGSIIGPAVHRMARYPDDALVFHVGEHPQDRADERRQCETIRAAVERSLSPRKRA